MGLLRTRKNSLPRFLDPSQTDLPPRRRFRDIRFTALRDGSLIHIFKTGLGETVLQQLGGETGEDGDVRVQQGRLRVRPGVRTGQSGPVQTRGFQVESPVCRGGDAGVVRLQEDQWEPVLGRGGPRPHPSAVRRVGQCLVLCLVECVNNFVWSGLGGEVRAPQQFLGLVARSHPRSFQGRL
jgi:hypothetical protein